MSRPSRLTSKQIEAIRKAPSIKHAAIEHKITYEYARLIRVLKSPVICNKVQTF